MQNVPPFKVPPIGAEAIRHRIGEMAGIIMGMFGTLDITILGILQGAIPFQNALTNALPVDARVRPFMFPARSYDGVTSGELEFDARSLPAKLITGRRVLLLDDILDTGKTLKKVTEAIHALGPQKLRSAVLLRKPGKCLEPVHVDLVGFDIPDEAFVVGFGMDYNGMYRSRPDIKVLEDAAAELRSGRGMSRKSRSG
jgi:hypoxanthine phosphoribosyltransferase